jgi:hypothetical protein
MTFAHAVRKLALATAVISVFVPSLATADETCNSPYMANLIKGQEDFVYVWTLGVEGLGDGQDKLVTIDVNPKSKSYGKVVASVSVGERGEAHHMGFTDDRRYLWAGGLSSNNIFSSTWRAIPLARNQDHYQPGGESGRLGPHAMPGRMLIGNLSSKDKGQTHRRPRAATRAASSPPVPIHHRAATATATTSRSSCATPCSPRASPAENWRPLGELIGRQAMRISAAPWWCGDLKVLKPKRPSRCRAAPSRSAGRSRRTTTGR